MMKMWLFVNMIEDDFIGLCLAVSAFLLGLTVLARFVVAWWMQRQLEDASAKVLAEFPEYEQPLEDVKVFARKVASRLGWDSVSFTYK